MSTIRNRHPVDDKAHNGHFYYNPWLIAASKLIRGVCFVSVSVDGVQLPKVYVLYKHCSASAHGIITTNLIFCVPSRQ